MTDEPTYVGSLTCEREDCPTITLQADTAGAWVGCPAPGCERSVGVESTTPLHPATTSLLGYFSFSHLPVELQAISEPFHKLAHRMAMLSSGPELTVCLRKLLEAKDCAVRAALPPT